MHLLVDRAGDEDPARPCEFLEPSGDIHAFAVDVGALDDHVAEVDTDSELHALGGGQIRIVAGKLLLDLDGALHRLDDARELGNDGIAPGIDDPTLVPLDEGSHCVAAAAQGG